MRAAYLVCYDIADDKRLRKVFKTCRNYGEHLQFSIFECELNPAEKVRLETELKDIVDHTRIRCCSFIWALRRAEATG